MRDETLTETLSLTDEEKPLPEGWRLVRLGDVCTIQLGKMLSPASKTGQRSRPYLRNANVQWNYFDLSDVAEMDFNEHEEEKFALKYGDLLVCEGGEPGRAAMWEEQLKPCFYQKALHRIRPLDNQVDSKFLMYRLWLGANSDEFLDSHAQTTIAHLPAVRLAELYVALPPTIEEQRRIASILDEQMKAVEEARRAVEAQLKAANLLPNAFLRSVFEGEEAQNWQKRKLGTFARVQSGFAFKTDWYVREGIRLLRNANIFQGYIDWCDVVKLSDEARPKFASYELNEGDIVLSLDRPLVSNGLKVARLRTDDVPSLLLQRVGRFILNDEIDSNYLYTFLNSDKFINSIKGHDQSLGVPHISPSQVENTEIPIPPTVEEQRKIAERLNEQMQEVETLKQSLTEKLEAVEKLPAALLRKAFAGEI